MGGKKMPHQMNLVGWGKVRASWAAGGWRRGSSSEMESAIVAGKGVWIVIIHAKRGKGGEIEVFFCPRFCVAPKSVRDVIDVFLQPFGRADVFADEKVTAVLAQERVEPATTVTKRAGDEADRIGLS